MKNKIIGIPSKNLWESWYNMYISIYKTLKVNWYTCYFLQPNKLVKKYLLKAKITDILETPDKKNIKKYPHQKKWEYKQLITYIKIFFWSIAYSDILKESLKEYFEYDSLIKQYNIDSIIIYNWIFRIARLAWLDNSCKIIYFENGYFPNTLQIDDQWINSESSIAKYSYQELLKYKRINNNLIKKIELFQEKDYFSLLQKFLLFLKSHSIKTNIFFIIYIIKKHLQTVIKKNILRFEKNIQLDKWKYFFIALQVHDDTQLIFNSPNINNMESLINDFYYSIKKILPEYTIVVKEHPMDIGRVNYTRLQKKYKDIIWIKKWDIDDIILKSDYTMCINSSVWLQALNQYKKVITLWNTFYNNNPFIENVKYNDEFEEKLNSLRNKHIDKKAVDKYINIFKNELFINWSWKWWAWENFNKKTIKIICEYIVK